MKGLLIPVGLSYKKKTTTKCSRRGVVLPEKRRKMRCLKDTVVQMPPQTALSSLSATTKGK